MEPKSLHPENVQFQHSQYDRSLHRPNCADWATFAFELENATNPYKPIVLGKKMFIIAAGGGSGFGAAGQYEKLNYQTPYLASIFGLIGITDITLIEVENDESGGQKLVDAIASACIQMTQLVGG